MYTGHINYYMTKWLYLNNTVIATTTSTVRAKQESKNAPRISLGDVVLSDEKLFENGFVKPIDPPKGKPNFY